VDSEGKYMHITKIHVWRYSNTYSIKGFSLFLSVSVKTTKRHNNKLKTTWVFAVKKQFKTSVCFDLQIIERLKCFLFVLINCISLYCGRIRIVSCSSIVFTLLHQYVDIVLIKLMWQCYLFWARLWYVLLYFC